MVGAGRKHAPGPDLPAVSTRSATWGTVRLAVERRARRAVSESERERTCAILLGAAMVVYAVLAMYLTRGVTLFVDGIQLFLQNRGFDPAVLLAPLNGHLVLMERSVYAADFGLFGANFVVIRLIETAGTLAAAGLVFVYVRRRVGSLVALPLALLALFLGSAWEAILLPEGMTNVYAAAAGLGAFLALDRRDLRGDSIASLLLVASIASWSLGLAFAVGAATRIILEPRWRRRIWVAVVPFALYGAWLAWVHATTLPQNVPVGQSVTVSNALLIPNFVADEAGAVAGALTGLNYDFTGANASLAVFSTELRYGIPIAAIAATALVFRLRRGRVHPALWAGLAALLSFWAILALGFGLGRNPTTVRYVYPGAVLVLVVAAEALAGIRPSRAVIIALAIVAVLALGANLRRLSDGASFLRGYSTRQRAQLTALEVARPHLRPGFAVQEAFLAIKARPYLAAVDRNGSPAFTPSELAAQPEGIREAADTTLASAIGLGLGRPAPGLRPGNCQRFASSPTRALLFAARPPGILIRADVPTAVSVSRFADQPTVSLGSTPAGKPSTLRIPRDALRAPWYVGVSANGHPVTVCESLR
jgi:hypothetical protein